MKRATFLPALLLALLSPALASAAPAPYAMQWPLTLASEDEGAYRVTLDASVYRQSVTPDLSDLDVLNADSIPVPTSLLDPEQPLAQRPPTVPVPWFTLPAPDPGTGGPDWRLVMRVDHEGRLRQIEVADSAPAGSTIEPAQRTSLLLDLSRIREPVVALQLQWKPLDELDLGYRVEASHDLAQWRTLPSRGRMIDLSREGRRLLRQRIQLDDLLPHRERASYLRLTPLDDAPALEITSVAAELAGGATPAAQWISLQPTNAGAAGPARSAGAAEFLYVMDGRFPVQQVDVEVPGNHALQWRLESRADADAPWSLRAGPWMAYALDRGGKQRQSAPRVLDRPVRDRYWRLTADAATGATTPTLRLGYHPEVAVFLAQGTPPYRLVAGSTRARRADAPLPQLVSTLRGQDGADWQPAQAYLGTPRVLAGASALEPPREWTRWLLWVVLALGAVVVGAFALSLLRTQRTPGG